MDINFYGLVRVVSVIRDSVKPRPVQIVCFTSSLARSGVDESSLPYSVAKGALDLFVTGSRSWLREEGLFLTSIDPGPFASEMNEQSSILPEAVARRVLAQLPGYTGRTLV
jgi:NAD(P)-dependent dehydrogenase (short-subunit alcohol dehydrogenase family)